MLGPFQRLVARLDGVPAPALGRGITLEGRPWVSCKGRLAIGERAYLSSSPVVSHLVVARGAVLEIGARVTIGHGAAIAAHGAIRIGEGTRLGPFVSISDTDFHVAGEREGRPAITPVTIGRNVRIGPRVTILRGSVIGDGATVEAGSVVSGLVPAGSVFGGVPARDRSLAATGQVQGTGLAALDDLPGVVGHALGATEVLTLDTCPIDVPAWDSLGALRVLLALEETYAVRLDQRGVGAARTVGELAELVRSARGRPS